jgi:1-acyl-sn-glycerol-3-phosphate acyltransferase
MIRAIVFAIIVIIVTAIWSSAAIVVGIFSRYSPIIYNNIARSWSKILLFVSGMSVEVYGKENIQPNTSYVVVSNHQSHLDIPVLVSQLPLRLTFLAKKELFKIPFFGWGMQAASILKIDRSNQKKAIQTLKDAEKIILDNGFSVMSFPEGTRSPDGEIHAFKKGPFVMAINTGLSILPISLRGTYDILPKKKLRIRPGKVKVRIHQPVETRDYAFETRTKLVDKVQQKVVEGFHEN